jgi:hypothetical protein
MEPKIHQPSGRLLEVNKIRERFQPQAGNAARLE